MTEQSLFIVRQGAVHPRSRSELAVEYERTSELPELFHELDAALARAQARLEEYEDEGTSVVWIVSGAASGAAGALTFLEVKQLPVIAGRDETQAVAAPTATPPGNGPALETGGGTS
jgi:hypothetical protein